jgi:hypothetical protein
MVSALVLPGVERWGGVVTLKLEELCEFVQDLQEKVVVLSQQLPDGMLVQIGAVAKEFGYLQSLRLLVYQVNALRTRR